MLHATCFGSKTSPPLLFLHGLLGLTEDFLSMIATLKKDFYCIGIDLPGHGCSSLSSPLTLESTLQALLDVIHHHKLDKPSIVGYSLGGRLAMLLDYYHPDLFDTIIVLSSHPGLNPDEKKERILIEKKWIALLEKDIDAFLKSWYSQPLFKTLEASSIVKRRSTINKDAIIQVMQALSITKQKSLWDHLNKIQKSCLFLYGQYDEKYKEIYKNLPPRLHQREILLASHAIHLENPLDCTRNILEFIDITTTSLFELPSATNLDHF